MIVPPFAGVALVECHDRIELAPLCWCREFVGLGRFDSREIGPSPVDQMHPFFKAVMKGRKIWVIATWRQYDNGQEEPLRLQYLDPSATRKQAETCFKEAVRFAAHSKEELVALTRLFKAKREDLEYIESRFPNIQCPNGSIEDDDLYQARLKVLGGFQPRTVQLIQKADTARNPDERLRLERKGIQAYFADLAHYWNDEQIKAWQRSNPLGADWISEFSRSRSEPKRELDPVNHALVLNWLRGKYNLLTAQELSDAIFRATGKRVSPATIKKRRERLGLTTKRPPGPRPNSDC